MKLPAEDRQEQILAYLVKHQGEKIRQREIAGDVGVSQQVVSLRLRQLMAAGKVRRFPVYGYQITNAE